MYLPVCGMLDWSLCSTWQLHHGWMDIIIDLITKYKCDTNCKDSDGRTPLHYAASNNHLEVVRYFINEQHCDPMTRDNDGDTPLHYACQQPINTYYPLVSTSSVNKTVTQSCERQVMVIHHFTWHACRDGWIKIVKYLLLISGYK